MPRLGGLSIQAGKGGRWRTKFALVASCKESCCKRQVHFSAEAEGSKQMDVRNEGGRATPDEPNVFSLG